MADPGAMIPGGDRMFRSICAAAKDAILLMDDHGRIRLCNPAAEEIFGYSASELLGEELHILLGPEKYHDAYRAAFPRFRETGEDPVVGKTLRLEARRKDGTIFPMELSVSSVRLEGKWHGLGLVRDVTEHERLVAELHQARQDLERRVDERTRALREANARLEAQVAERRLAERALRQSEATLASVFRAAPIGIALVKNRILGWTNEMFCRMLGYEPGELRGQSARVLYADGEEYERVGRVHYPQGEREGTASFETRWKTKQGEVRDIFLSAALIEPGDLSAGIVSTALDITERKQAEEALRRSEASYRALIRNAVYGIYRSNRAGRFLEVNPALVSMLGYESAEELLKADLARDIYERPEDRAALIESIRGRETLTGLEVRWKKRDGTPITLRLSGRALRNEEGVTEGWEMIAEDVTERQALESQLRQAQKLEGIGRLAGGIAHDFNNLLTAINGYAEMLLKATPEDDPRHRMAREIHRAGRRAASLTGQLLAFSRRQVLEPRALDLNEVVEDMEEMLRRLIGEDIRLRCVLEPGLGRIRADRGQVEQVILNLVLNARDAMPGGGDLTLATGSREIPDPAAAGVPRIEPGSYARLEVRDTGTGMDEKTLEHLFEPFFTTKGPDRGTGLGLSTVYGIVRQSGGGIRVRSRPGRGTTFTVYLPLAGEPAAAPPPSRSPAEAGAADATVLVVEDEEAVRELAQEILAGEGYTVLTAGSAEEAYRICERHRGPIHALLSDVILPGPSGPEIADELRRRIPGLAVLFMSGYTGDAIVRKGVREPETSLLAKPFAADELVTRIREVLAASSTAGA